MLLSAGRNSATYVSCSDDLILAVPDQTVERQQTGGDVQHRARRLLWRARVHDSDAAVVSGESEGIAARGEADTLDPASSVVQEFTTDGVEGETLSPSARLRALVNTLDEAREDAGVGVGGARSQEHGVGVPGEGGDGTTDRLLQVLGDPPVVLLLEVADGDYAGSRADGELLLRGRPAHKGGGTVDAEQDEGGLPAGSGLLPNVSIAVCRGGERLVGRIG